MRKLKLQVQMSVDSYVAGPNGELDWMIWNWDNKLKKYVSDLTDPVDTILLGRKMADGFISHWESVASQPDNPEFASGIKFTETPKVVFTKTMKKSEWNNTTLATGNLTDEINNLKTAKGKDIIVYGGATFVSSLIKEKLVDEYHIFVNPVALGKGMTIFNNLDDRLNLSLVKSTSFDCGIVLLNYVPL